MKARSRHAQLFFAIALALLGTAVTAKAADDIPPPFGFHWKDSMTRVEQVLVGASMDQPHRPATLQPAPHNLDIV